MTSPVALTGEVAMTGALRRSLPMLRRHRRVLIGAAAGSVAVAVAEILGPILIGVAIDAVVDGDRDRLSVAAAAYAAITVVLVAMGVVRQRLAARGSEAFLADLRGGLVTTLLAQPLSFFERHRSGELLGRATTDIDRLSRFVRDGLPTLVDTGLLLAVTSVVLVSASWQLTVVALVYVPGLLIAVRRYHHASTGAYRELADAETATTAALAETIAARQTLQGLGATRRWMSHVSTVDRRLLDANDAALLADNRLSVLGLWQHLTVAAVLVAGGLLVADDAISVGTIATFALALRQLFSPVESLAWLYADAQQARVSLARVLQVLDLGGPALARRGQHQTPGYDVELRGIDHRYDGGPDVLVDVDVHVRAGERVAVIGPTGAGKSTLAKIAAGLLEPTRGEVLIGGVRVGAWSPADLRRAVVFLPQESFVASGTLAANLRLVAPERNDDELEAMLESLGLGPWLERLPNGITTELHDRGANLSAGERQLV